MSAVLQLEYFRPIPGWENHYAISNVGRIVRTRAGMGATVGKTAKWHHMPKTGYAKVGLCRNSVRKEYLVHRLVAMAFIGDPGALDVCHFNGWKWGNRLSNLRIDTRAANVADNLRLDRHNRGERCGSNKYSQGQIVDIKRRLADGARPCTLAAETGMPVTTIHSIKNGYSWGWLNV